MGELTGRAAAPRAQHAQPTAVRDTRLRAYYAEAALAQIPRVLTLVDRNPYRETYGCFDRNYWHYRTTDFPSGMYQEAVLSLALVWAHPFPGNRWYRQPWIKQLALAGMRFAVRSAHEDGSCDDYYPWERALGATVFALYACAEAYRLLEVHDLEILAGLEQRARWLLANDESGRLTNHQAWAALALHNVYELTGHPRYLAGVECRLRTVLHWQSREGWFQEYDGCDPGYLSVAIDALAKYHRRTGDPVVGESLRRAVGFARHFLHPDDSYAGHYGSRGTSHFYPHGMELLSQDEPAAAELAEAFLRCLARGETAALEDDRLFTHRLPNLLQAYLDWDGNRGKGNRGEEAEGTAAERPTSQRARESPQLVHGDLEPSAPLVRDRTWTDGPSQLRRIDAAVDVRRDGGVDHYFPEARIYVRRRGDFHAVVSCAKGGALKLYVLGNDPVCDAGVVIETDDGRVCASHLEADWAIAVENDCVDVRGPMHWVCRETATPLKQVLFRLGLALVGRRHPQRVRRLLQRRLITGRRAAPVTWHRTIRWGPPVEIIDELELTDADVEVRRLAISPDACSIYTAAGDVYAPPESGPWLDLSDRAGELNRQRRIRICRRCGRSRGVKEPKSQGPK